MTNHKPLPFYYKNNRLQQLRGFCFTAQFGSVTKAAQFMGLTQPNVSLQIKALESDLGVSLFRRSKLKLSLTPQGEKLLAISLPLLDGLQKLPETFQAELDADQESEITIAVNSTTLNFLLPPIIKNFIDLHPETYFTLHYAEQPEAIQLLRDGKVDIALLPRREHMPFPKDCEYMPLFYYTACLITRPDHPLAGRHNLSVEEISRYELSLPDRDLRVIPNLYDIFPNHKINKKLRVRFINWETTRKYIEAGLVISISSDVILGKDDPLVATPLSHLFAPVDYGFVKMRNKDVPDKVSRFMALAQNHSSAVDSRASSRTNSVSRREKTRAKA